MSRVRILVLATLSVLLLLVGSVWLLPGMLDWNRYREGIATLASARVGRPVHIGGAVTLHLLPQPILTAADVSVEDDGDGIGLKARALRLRVGLAALLSGRVEARELTLQGAELRLPWPLPPGALARRPPSWISGLRARVEDGRLQVGAAVLERIDGTLATDPDTGTLSAAGVGQEEAPPPDTRREGARRWQFTARLTRPGRDGAAGLDVSLDGQDRLRDTGGTFSGQLDADGSLSGRVAGRGPDLSQVLPAPAVAWRGDGRLSATGGLAVADDLALEIGGVPARGTVALRVTPHARLDVALATGRLDLDAWLPALLTRSAVQPGLPTGIDLSADAASWGGGTVRRVRAALDLGTGEAGGGVTLSEVSAVLPGETQVRLEGRTDGTAPTFTGRLDVSAPDLRTTLRWARPWLPDGLGDLPQDGMRRASLSAGMVAGTGSVALTEIQGTLDGSAVTGSAGFRSGKRPAVTAALTVDRAPLDRWTPPALRVPAFAPSSVPVLLARLRQMDATVRLQAGQASWSDIPLGPAVLEVQTEASRVVLRRLELQPLGARLSVAGQLGDTGRLTDGRAELAVPDLATLRPLLPAELSPALDRVLRGPGNATVQASGPPDALAARATLEVSDIRVESQPVLNLSARRAAGALTIHHPGAPRLLQTLGIGDTVAWLGDGSLSLVGQFAVAPGRLEVSGATLSAGSARATGAVTWDGGRLTGQVAAETLPLPGVFPRSPDPLPIAWMRGVDAALHLEAAQVLVGLEPVMQAATADATLAGGTLRLSGVTGRAMGGTVSGTASLQAAANPPVLTLGARAAGVSVPSGLLGSPLDLVAGQADLRLDLSATGHSPAALLATVNGSGDARVKDGLLQGIDLAALGPALQERRPGDALAAARDALAAGSTPFTAADAAITVRRGVMSVDGTLLADAGKGTLGGTVDLRDGTEDLTLTLHPGQPGAPGLGVRLSGPAAGPKRTPELAPLARWLAERLDGSQTQPD